ncbi:Polynucleotide 5'-hydroxyl-kinase GRC3 [Paramyrothecium foliicola]|nr:Polynucleotide 5'-hydroxyl-kinase GRC3 [Paramyrothecium foliicola]
MSSSKRRKIDAQDSPSPAVSALSALAARRRLATNSPAEASPSPSPSSVPTRANAYSALQLLKGKEHRDASQLESSEPAKKGSPRTPQRRLNTQRPSTDQGSSTTVSNVKSLNSKIIQYSSFRPTKRNQKVKGPGIVELNLEESERFLVLGSFGIRVLAGGITVAGATLRPSDKIYWVHAPHCHALPVLRTAENTHLELHEDSLARDLRLLGRLSPLFRKLWNDPVGDSAQRPGYRNSSYRILCTSEDAPRKSLIQDLVSPPEWNRVLASIVSAATKADSYTILVCGPKSAGKSTFSRLLANRLLTRADQSGTLDARAIAFLDLDPGQPEFSPAGTLSLVEVKEPNLGTPFTHSGLGDGGYHVVRRHALASITPASAPELFLQFNTPGWIQGTGLDILSEVIKKFNPQQVTYLSEEGPVETVETLRNATKHIFDTIPSNQSEFVSRTAAHFRSMQTMSYFHGAHMTDARQPSRSGWNSSPLSTIPPWLIRFNGPNRGIMSVLSYDYQPLPHIFADTINGMILAAVEIEDHRAFHGFIADGIVDEDVETVRSEDKTFDPEALVSRTPEGLPYIPNINDVALDPRYSRCIGLVLIRGIDPANQQLHVISPISLQEIEQVKKRGREIVLVHGKFDAPNWAYTEDLYERSQLETGADKEVEILDDDTSQDDSEAEPEHVQDARDVTETPWVESLAGDEKRPVGSKAHIVMGTPAFTHSSEVDVLIVGAGPAGLMLALWMARLGAKTRIVDKRTGKVFSGQADGFQMRTLEILDSFGIGERIWQEANHMLEVSFWNPDEDGVIRRNARASNSKPGLSRFTEAVLHQGRMETFFMEAIGASASETHPAVRIERQVMPVSLHIDEQQVEDIDAYPVEVMLRHLSESEATPTQKLSNLQDGLFRSNLTEDDTDQILAASKADAREEVIRAKYVVGCGGAHSWVRKTLGQEFEMVGESTDAIWGVLDIVPITDFPDIRNRCIVHSAEAGTLVVIPRENRLVRLYIQLKEVSEGTGRVDRSQINPGLILKAAQDILTPYKFEYYYIDWWTAYQIGQRSGDHFSKLGREFLAGDAVHTHSPKAGQGMNVSMQDTYNLGWKLGLVCKKILQRKVLTTYEWERKQIAKELIAFD